MRYQGCRRRDRLAFAVRANVDERTINRLLQGEEATREEAYRAAAHLRAAGYTVRVRHEDEVPVLEGSAA